MSKKAALLFEQGQAWPLIPTSGSESPHHSQLLLTSQPGQSLGILSDICPCTAQQACQMLTDSNFAPASSLLYSWTLQPSPWRAHYNPLAPSFLD